MVKLWVKTSVRVIKKKTSEKSKLVSCIKDTILWKYVFFYLSYQSIMIEKNINTAFMLETNTIWNN